MDTQNTNANEHSPYFCMTLADEGQHSPWHPLGIFRPSTHVASLSGKRQQQFREGMVVPSRSWWTEGVEDHPLTAAHLWAPQVRVWRLHTHLYPSTDKEGYSKKTKEIMDGIY